MKYTIFIDSLQKIAMTDAHVVLYYKDGQTERFTSTDNETLYMTITDEMFVSRTSANMFFEIEESDDGKVISVRQWGTKAIQI